MPYSDIVTIPYGQYKTRTDTTGFTALGSDIAGAWYNVLDFTGTLGGAANVQLPTVAAMVAAIPNAFAAQAFILRCINNSGGAFAWTVTTNTGWTLTGTMGFNQGIFRDFHVTLNSLTAATIQNIGKGTT